MPSSRRREPLLYNIRCRIYDVCYRVYVPYCRGHYPLLTATIYPLRCSTQIYHTPTTTASALASTILQRIASDALLQPISSLPAPSISLCPAASHPYPQLMSLIFVGCFLFFSICTVKLLPPLLPHALGASESLRRRQTPAAVGDDGVLSLHEAVFPVLHRCRISLDVQRHFRGRIPNPSLLQLLLLWLPADLPQLTICVLALSASTPSLF
ncbi:hypothetical protein GW17_00058829 [Ensete ventricosum]|nr:hypothetical protein GW17_00058829 [Ensete ventricosum]